MRLCNWYIVAGMTLAILLLSLAIYSRTYIGWESPGNFDVDVTHTALGVPHWLVINDLEVEGTPPPIDARYLPEADIYQPGWHFRPLQFLASVFLCVVLAVPIGWLLIKARPPARRWPFILPCVLAIGVGAIVPTDPNWIGAVVGLTVLPLCLIGASAIGRSYLFACVAGIVTVLLLWASVRLVDVFTDQHLVHGLPDEDDLMCAALFLPAVLILVVVATFVGRWIVDREPHNHRLQLTSDARDGEWCCRLGARFRRRPATEPFSFATRKS